MCFKKQVDKNKRTYHFALVSVHNPEDRDEIIPINQHISIEYFRRFSTIRRKFQEKRGRVPTNQSMQPSSMNRATKLH